MNRTKAASNARIDAALDASVRRARRSYPARTEYQIQGDLDAIVARAAEIKADAGPGAAGTPELPSSLPGVPVSRLIWQVASAAAPLAQMVALVLIHLIVLGPLVDVHSAAIAGQAAASGGINWVRWVWLSGASVVLVALLLFQRAGTGRKPARRPGSSLHGIRISVKGARPRQGGRERAAS